MNQEGSEPEPDAAAAAAASAAVKVEEDAVYDTSTDDEANIDDDRSNKRRKTTGDDDVDLTPGQLMERLLQCDADAMEAGLKEIDVTKIIGDAKDNEDETALKRLVATSHKLMDFSELLYLRAFQAQLPPSRLLEKELGFPKYDDKCIVGACSLGIQIPRQYRMCRSHYRELVDANQRRSKRSMPSSMHYL